MPSGISFSSHRRSKSYPHPMQHHAIASSNSRPGLARSPSASTSYFTHHNHTLPNPSSHHDDLSRSHHSYLDHTIFHPHNTFPRRPSHSHQSHQRLQSFSLLGALEFRNVVTSLQRESGVAVLAAFDSPVSPSYVGGHYDFPRRLSRRSSRSSTSTRREGDIRSSDEMELQGGEAGSENVAPRSPSIGRSHSPSTRRQRNGLLAPEAADDTLAPGASPPERHSHRRDASSSTLSSSSTAPHADGQLTIAARRAEGGTVDSRPNLTLDVPLSPSRPPVLALPTPSPIPAATPLSAPALPTNEPEPNTSPEEHETTSSTLVPQTIAALKRTPKSHSLPPTRTASRRKRWMRRLKRIAHVLFPTLVNLKGKTALGKSAAVLAAPAVFFLTLTLPVVVLREGGGLHGSGPDSRGLSEPSIRDDDDGQDHRGLSPSSSRRRSEAEDRVREGRLIDLESPLPRSGDALERSYHSLMDWASPADEPELDLEGEPNERQRISHEDEQLTLRIDDNHDSSGVPAVQGAGTVRPQLQLNDDPIPTSNSNDEDESYETSSPTLEASNLPTSHRRSSSGTYASSSSSEAPPTPRLFNKYLTAAQLIFGPAFCIAVCFISMPRLLPWLLLAAFVVGVSGAMLVVVFGDGERGLKGKVRLEGPEDERFLVGGEEVLQLHAEEDDDLAAVEMLSQQSEKTGIAKVGVGRLALCLMGFTVAMVWIMAIADEVVQVLTTFGLIFGLSDAIIGLTIFAIGNSLADFVADITVAQFAPIMGFSACFGGPMLNILLGIGLSGTFVIAQTGEAYPVEFDNTLLVSCVGLLALLVATLIWVPWNGYFLDRRWGLVLILAYACIMAANVLVEIFFSSRS
ncbi:hypothetical protein DL93DRAFT_1051915 [Clavulina sp. PMI_390]|nr:hypothetical protein DL93DRAFT_1051915 [Clavulina sp. PMI_390]